MLVWLASNHHETRSGVQRSGTQRSGTPFRGTVGPARLFWAPALWLVLLLDIFLQLFFLAPWRAQLQRPHHAQPHWFERACVSKPLRLKKMFRQGSGVFTLVLPASPHDFRVRMPRRRRPRGLESRPRYVLRPPTSQSLRSCPRLRNGVTTPVPRSLGPGLF